MILKIETKTTGQKWTREFPSWKDAVEWAERVLPVWAKKHGDDIDASGPGGRALAVTTGGVSVMSD